jgi:hypothetical protein
VVADDLGRLDMEISHLTLNHDAISELFENSNNKSLNIDYPPLSTAVIAKH